MLDMFFKSFKANINNQKGLTRSEWIVAIAMLFVVMFVSVAIYVVTTDAEVAYLELLLVLLAVGLAIIFGMNFSKK